MWDGPDPPLRIPATIAEHRRFFAIQYVASFTFSNWSALEKFSP
jgi:hypothetical protein